MPREYLIDGFASFLTSERNYSEHTVRSYLNDLKDFTSFLEAKGICFTEAETKDIKEFLLFLHKKNSRSTVSRKITSIRSFYSYLIREGEAKSNPAKLVNPPKKERTLPTFLSVDEVFSLVCSSEDETPLAKRNRAILELLYSSGLRVSEVSSIKLNQIDLEDSIIKVLGKGKKERIVPVGSKAVKALKDYLVYREKLKPRSEFLFLNNRGKKLSSRSIGRIVKKLAILCGISKDVSPHVLRHTFATHMLGSGADLRVIQEMLGHSNLSTTQKYTHTSIEQLMKIYDKSHPHA